jgi:hypothetical protein
MTQDEQKALVLVQGGLELLRNAAVKGDPYREIEFRARDLVSDVRAILNGNSRFVASLPSTMPRMSPRHEGDALSPQSE